MVTRREKGTMKYIVSFCLLCHRESSTQRLAALFRPVVKKPWEANRSLSLATNVRSIKGKVLKATSGAVSKATIYSPIFLISATLGTIRGETTIAARTRLRKDGGRNLGPAATTVQKRKDPDKFERNYNEKRNTSSHPFVNEISCVTVARVYYCCHILFALVAEITRKSR